MRYLLDASSLLLLIKNADIKSTVDCLEVSSVLDLTFYEVGNAIWKESTLTKYLTPKEAERLGMMAQTVLAKINRVTINEAEAFQRILEIAQTERLSYYDSSYVYAAKENGLPLITEDTGLITKARKHVEVSTVAALTTH
jgi:predicted nucleic acid-binding protein